MSDMKLDEGDIRDLFAATPVYEDARAFEARVMRGLRLKLWLRQGFVSPDCAAVAWPWPA